MKPTNRSHSPRRRALPRRLPALALAIAAAGAALACSAPVAAAHTHRAHHGRSAKSKAKPKTPPPPTLLYEVALYEIPPGTSGWHESCPAHYYAIGGGFYNQDAHLQLLASNPYDTEGRSLPSPPDSWGVEFNNTDTIPLKVDVYAVCITNVRISLG